MASESTVAAEPINDSLDFDSLAPQNTVYIKWDVKGGGDRVNEPHLNTNYTLNGTPNIQGIEIKSAINVKVLCWSGPVPSGPPNIVIDGPTNGKHKIDPRRLGSYRVEVR